MKNGKPRSLPPDFEPTDKVAIEVEDPPPTAAPPPPPSYELPGGRLDPPSSKH